MIIVQNHLKKLKLTCDKNIIFRGASSNGGFKAATKNTKKSMGT
jgi:hypothetical protein